MSSFTSLPSDRYCRYEILASRLYCSLTGFLVICPTSLSSGRLSPRHTHQEASYGNKRQSTGSLWRDLPQKSIQVVSFIFFSLLLWVYRSVLQHRDCWPGNISYSLGACVNQIVEGGGLGAWNKRWGHLNQMIGGIWTKWWENLSQMMGASESNDESILTKWWGHLSQMMEAFEPNDGGIWTKWMEHLNQMIRASETKWWGASEPNVCDGGYKYVNKMIEVNEPNDGGGGGRVGEPNDGGM